MIKSFEDFQAMGKENVEAYIASANAFTKGIQTIATEAAEYSRKSFEKGSEVTEQVMAAKSFDKALEVQQGFAKEAFEGYVAQLNKMGELYAAAAKDAYKPFEGQMSKLGIKTPAAK